MKKVAALALCLVIALSLLASCSAKTSAPASSALVSSSSVADKATTQMESGGSLGYSASQSADTSTGEKPKDGGLTQNTVGMTLSPDKIIYAYSATVETKSFDDSLDKLKLLLAQYGAFVETSYISGASYGSDSFRTASYTLRVPVKNFISLTGGLDVLGNVYNENTTSQNITAQFTDTQSRLDAYATEEHRLLAMLDKAQTVEDMITIESRLSDVRYQIESLTSTLRNWQNQVDYSTVSLSIVEVEQLKDQQNAPRTYWEKIGDGFKNTLNGIGSFFKVIFMGIVIGLPVIVLLVVLLVIAAFIIRYVRKKKNTPPDDPNPPQ